VYLASSASDYMTGQTVSPRRRPHGGLTCWTNLLCQFYSALASRRGLSCSGRNLGPAPGELRDEDSR